MKKVIKKRGNRRDKRRKGNISKREGKNDEENNY